MKVRRRPSKAYTKSGIKSKKSNLKKIRTTEMYEDMKDRQNLDENDSSSCSEAMAAESSGEEGDFDGGVKHQKSLSKLKEIDPEFYKYLQENDQKLLQFSCSDSDGDDRDDEELCHKPPDELQVDSEESDVEGEERLTNRSITLSMVDSWRRSLTDNPNLADISTSVKAFHAALEQVTGEENSGLKVEGSAVFNAVVELCVMHLQPAVICFLKLPTGSIKHPEKSKKWVKVKSVLHSYFSDLLKLMTGVASEHIISVLLKHLHTACPLLACFGKLSKVAIKHLTKLWSSGEETVRVLAFLCILRLCTYKKSGLLNSALKCLYIAYIQNSNFVSVNSLPQINFMMKSLACLFSLDTTLSYQHAFLYIRQLAIHLRNAVTTHRKENFQSVYNWQYIQSLRLWAELLCSMKESAELRQLLFPLVQIIIGCIKLIPTAQYAPLRFHCVKLLIKLGYEMDTHIPTIPFIIETLHWVDSSSTHKKLSMKPFDFTCVLRLSKSAMTENGFKDAIIENVYNLMLETAACCSHTVTYPDMLVPAISQLKAFLKDCHIGKYTSKLRQLLLKLEENSKLVNEERNRLSISISNVEMVSAFESKLLARKPPLLTFWEQWNKINSLRTAQKATNNVKLGDFNLPLVKRKLEKRKPIENTESNGAVLFPSDDESDMDLKIEKPDGPKVKKNKKIVKKKSKQSKRAEEESIAELDQDDVKDVVEDLDVNSF